MDMITWKLVRYILYTVAFADGLLSRNLNYDEALWSMYFQDPLAVSIIMGIPLIVIPFALLFVIGIQSINPMIRAPWPYPSHESNPLRFSQPLNFFHFAASMILASAAGDVFSVLWVGFGPLLGGMHGLVAGLITLESIQLCATIFKFKMKVVPSTTITPMGARPASERKDIQT